MCFSSDPAVSSSTFVGAEREENLKRFKNVLRTCGGCHRQDGKLYQTSSILGIEDALFGGRLNLNINTGDDFLVVNQNLGSMLF